jgi:hypothetical protein
MNPMKNGVPVRLAGAIICTVAATSASAQVQQAERFSKITLPDGPAVIHVSAKQGATFTRHSIDSFNASQIEVGEYWENLDYKGNGTFFFNLDDPPTATFGHEAGDWGDVADGSFVQSIAIGYATDLLDPNFVGITGLDLVVNFYVEYEGFGAPAVHVTTIIVEDLPGAATAGQASLVTGTIDLTVTGSEFCITGPDLDGDGLTDFGYGYSFVQAQTGAKGTIGPLMALPATLGGLGNATGVEDAFDEFEGPLQLNIIGTFNFGGTPPTQPVASFYMALDSNGSPCPSGNTCYADCDGSTGAGVLDIFDFLCFQTSFVTGSSYACDCDQTTGPGVCDIFDFLCFQSSFVAGCP